MHENTLVLDIRVPYKVDFKTDFIHIILVSVTKTVKVFDYTMHFYVF